MVDVDQTASLADRFAALGPWVTTFRVDGIGYGGEWPVWEDIRLVEVAQAFPGVRTILEIGALEGGHTFELAKLPGVERVVAIEGRADNVARARFAQGVLGIDNVEFIEANVEDVQFWSLGTFDLVFCSGLLYHLPEPWKLLEQIAQVTDQIFLWTHYIAENDVNTQVQGIPPAPSNPIARLDWYRHRMLGGVKPMQVGYTYGEYGLEDALSGMSDVSLWPTLAGLQQMLVEGGFCEQEIVRDEPDHPHAGPAVVIAARRGTRLERLRARYEVARSLAE